MRDDQLEVRVVGEHAAKDQMMHATVQLSSGLPITLFEVVVGEGAALETRPGA